MNTAFENVFDNFLSKIRDYDFVKLTQDELNEELIQKLKSAFPKCEFENVELNLLMEEFTRELSSLEIEALSYWLVYEWVTPMVNNVELFKYKLASSDYKKFSEANHLKQMLNIRDSAYSDASYYSNKVNIKNMNKGLM